jgi:hypothetical protein
MKRAVLSLAALTFGALLLPARSSHGSAAIAATPTPAALQYDEINRTFMPPATPVPPGSFQTDYQAILSAASNGGSAQGGGIAGLMASAMSGNIDNPQKAMALMSLGNVTRYTYYKGWIRTDDLVAQRATIEKCLEHQYIILDLAKKTYAIQSTQPPCPATQVPGAPSHYSSTQPLPPGSADMTISGTSKDLGPLTIDGVATSGADYSVQTQLTNATGSCRGGDFAMAQTRYVSAISLPRAYCPLPNTMTGGGMMSAAPRGGCQTRMHVNGAISGFNDFDHLVMYSRMSMGRSNGVGIVVERGNVKWLSGSAADALFTIPAGFTQSG